MPHDYQVAVNDLISTYRDSEEAFGKAAKGVHSVVLRDLFTGSRDFYRQLVTELQEHGKEAGFETADEGHGGGPLSSGRVELETRIRPKTDQEFMENTLRSEETTLRHLETALGRTDLPENLREIVQRHHRSVRQLSEDLRTRQVEQQHA